MGRDRGRRRPGKRRQRRAPAPVRRFVARVVGRLRSTTGAVLAGDRPFLIVVVVLLGLGALMMSAPLHHYLQGQERVELLETKKAALQQEIERLEGRRADLNDPNQIELIAREQLGLVAPGEIPYVVVTPEPDRPQVAPADDVQVPDLPWYRRVWDAVVETVP